jgi:Fe-Mn family superoxide dismutase
METIMRYQLTPMFHRPYLLNDLSQKLIESHYENNYGSALRRLNAITESQVAAGGIPLLALDMYEHAYHIDFGANAKAYVDAFMRNINWKAVEERYEKATGVEPLPPLAQPEFGDVPGITVEEVKAMLEGGKSVQIIDARPQHYVSRTQNIIEGAVWRDPERVQEWARELSKSDPVVVFCMYGFDVGCKTAIALRDVGFDAKYMKGGHSAWVAFGGPTKMRT